MDLIRSVAHDVQPAEALKLILTNARLSLAAFGVAVSCLPSSTATANAVQALAAAALALDAQVVEQRPLGGLRWTPPKPDCN